MAQERKRWKVLMLGSRECDCAEQISRVLAHHAVVDVADSMADATRLLGAGTGSTPGGKVSAAGRIPRPDATSGSGCDAFLCDWNFAGGGWQGAYEKFHLRAPETPFIVVCRTGGEREWMQVLNAGAFDLIGAPYHEAEILAVLEHAVASKEATAVHAAS